MSMRSGPPSLPCPLTALALALALGAAAPAAEPDPDARIAAPPAATGVPAAPAAPGPAATPPAATPPAAIPPAAIPPAAIPPAAIPPAAIPPASPVASRAAEATDIRDIRGPHPLRSPWRVPLAVAAGLALLGCAFALWHLRRRREVPVPGSRQRALERLHAARAMLRPELAREFSIEVSATVREFIEAHYAVAAAHRTTDEFLRDLVRVGDGPLAAQRGLLADFLAECDLAKFGGWRLAPADMERLLERARAFVLASQDTAAPPRTAVPSRGAAGLRREVTTDGSVPSA